jgi:hypothetical protein
MKPRDCFGIVVRSIGLLLFALGLGYFFSSIWIFFVGPQDAWLVWTFSGLGIVYFAIRLYLLRGAPHVVRFAYGGEKEEPKPKGPE